MKQLITLASIFFLAAIRPAAQPPLKLDYFKKIPVAIKDCGALYTYDSIPLKKKKYILLTDFQNLGMIMVGGKQIRLALKDAKTIGETNITSYEGGGYSVELSSKTTGQAGKQDLEAGALEIRKGKRKLIINVHGESGCDESKQEGNSFLIAM